MVLTEAQITDIIVKNPNRTLVARGQAYNKKLRMHCYGEGLQTHLKCIDGFEKEALKKLRVDYTASNKDLFARLGRPVDNVFSARGGSVYFNLPEAQDKKARTLMKDVRNGYSLRKWIEIFWTPHLKDDPFGMIFMEILPQQEAVLAKQQGRGFVYPTYASINSIYDYAPKGQLLDYVVFTLSNAEKQSYGLKPEDRVYRLVDDAFDYLVQRVDDKVTILAEHTLPNFFTYVPGILNSDIVDPNADKGVLSLFDDCIELADRFLLKGSIAVTHDFMHGFPKYWEYADDCLPCNGTGFIGHEKCGDCKGSGKKAMTKVSDAKLLPYPKKITGEQEDIVITPDVAGYISPDKTFYEISVSSLQLLEDLMNVTLWGTQSRVRTQGMAISGDGTAKTATEIMDQVKPQANRLHSISEMAESRHKFAADCIIRIQVNQAYEGSSISYGRRYMLEGPDALWDKYAVARKDGASQEVLNEHLMEYYEAKYTTDPVKLTIVTKLMKVEPFVHNTVTEIDTWPVTSFEKLRKTYFAEWRSVKTDSELLAMDVGQLKKDLSDFVLQKMEEDSQVKDKTPLAIKLGVGGTQAFRETLADPMLDPESKTNALIHLFGADPVVAASMVPKKPVALPGPAPKDPVPPVEK